MPEEIKDVNVEEQAKPEKPQEKQAAEQPKDEKPDVQALMLEIAKLKRTNDKLSSEAADYKHKWKETLTAQEQASMEKAEAEAAREEHYKQLEKENAVFKFERNFAMLGYTEQQAHDAAIAQYDGDYETLNKLQREVQDATIKKAQEEWMKTRPPVQAGSGSNEPEDLFLKGFNSVKPGY